MQWEGSGRTCVYVMNSVGTVWYIFIQPTFSFFPLLAFIVRNQWKIDLFLYYIIHMNVFITLLEARL